MTLHDKCHEEAGPASTQDEGRAPARRTFLSACLLFIVVLVTLQLNGRAIVSLDSIPYRYLPDAILLDRTFSLDRFPFLADASYYAVVRDKRGRLISKKPAAPALLGLPAFGLYRLIKGEFPEKPTHRMLLGKLTMSMVGALTAVALLSLLRRLGLKRRWLAWGSAAGLIVLTPFWFTAMDFWPHPLLALLNTTSLLFLISGPTPRTWAQIGLLQGAAIAARPGAAAVAVVFFAAAFLLHTSAPSARWKRPAAMAAGLAIPLALLGWYNAVHFGSAWSTGFGDQALRRLRWPFEGAAGLLVSPAKGLFVYSPVLLFALAAIGSPLRRRAELRIAAAACVLHIIFWACYSDWMGGWCYGPRYLADVLPFIVMLAAAGLDAALARDRLRRTFLALTAVLCVVSFAIQCIGFYGWDAGFYKERGPRFIEQYGWTWTVAPEYIWILRHNTWYWPQHIP